MGTRRRRDEDEESGKRGSKCVGKVLKVGKRSPSVSEGEMI